MRRILAALAAIALLATTAACGSDDDADAGTGSSAAGDTTTLTVFAAASLTSTFTELGAQFEQAHDGVKVSFNFGGSSGLVTQLQEGAQADVFASADQSNMDKAIADDLMSGAPVFFASNTLQIVVPAGNPAGVRNLGDLADPDVKTVVCAPEVPCGAATVAVEKASGVDVQAVSEEQSVTDVLNKVVTGEADAGLVYVTDVIAAGDKVEGIHFPESDSVVNSYPIAPLAGSDHAKLAGQFVDFVLGETGQQVLTDAGFGRP